MGANSLPVIRFDSSVAICMHSTYGYLVITAINCLADLKADLPLCIGQSKLRIPATRTPVIDAPNVNTMRASD